MTKISARPSVRRAPRHAFAGYDWPRILGDIAWLLGEADAATPQVRNPVGGRVLGEYLGVSRSTLLRWLDEDAEPRHVDGEYVIAVWVDLTGKARRFLPVRAVSFSASKLKQPG